MELQGIPTALSKTFQQLLEGATTKHEKARVNKKKVSKLYSGLSNEDIRDNYSII